MSEKTEQPSNVIAGIHLSMGDSGFGISVRDEGHGPTIVFNSSAWGNIVQQMKIHTTQNTLTKIGNMFLDAALHSYSPEYGYAARDLSKVGYGGGSDEDYGEDDGDEAPTSE